MLLIVHTTVLNKLQWDPEHKQRRYPFHFNRKRGKNITLDINPFVSFKIPNIHKKVDDSVPALYHCLKKKSKLAW